MPTSTKKNVPPPLKRVATLDHLKAKRAMERQISIMVEDVDEPPFPRPDDEKPEEASAVEVQRWKDAKKAWDEYDRKVDEVTVWMTFRSIGPKAWDALIDAHQATPEQKAQDPEATWNPETFIPALIAASCVEPKLTAEDVVELLNDESSGFNNADVQEMFLTAFAVNNQKRTAAVGNGFGATLG